MYVKQGALCWHANQSVAYTKHNMQIVFKKSQVREEAKMWCGEKIFTAGIEDMDEDELESFRDSNLHLTTKQLHYGFSKNWELG